MSHFTLRPDGIEIHGPFKTRFFAWNDIAGFVLRETNARGIFGAGLAIVPPMQGWMTVRGGDRHKLKGVTTDEQVLELNRVLEDGRSGHLVGTPTISAAPSRSRSPVYLVAIVTTVVLGVLALTTSGLGGALFALGGLVFLVIATVIYNR